MTAEKKKQSTPWYKHILFLIVLNIIGGIMSFLLSLIPSAGTFGTTSIGTGELSMLGALLGIMDGGILGYTIRTSTDDFPQSRAILIAGIWGTLLGGIFFTGDNIIFTGCGFPILAYILTFLTLKHSSQVVSIVGATFFSIVSMLISGWVMLIIINITSDLPNIEVLVPVLIGLITYSTLLPYLLKSDNNRQRTQNAERAQRQQLQNDLSAGLLPEENYTVSDDGELIPINDDAQNNHKAQS